MASPSPTQVQKDATSIGGKSVRVMIVDDALVIRGVLTRMLEAEGDISVVSSVQNGERALVALERTDVDVVVLDIEMPVMDGLTLLPQIVKRFPDVRVIMASTLTERNAKASIEALQLGASDYIAKPSSTNGMIGAVDFKVELVGKVRALGRSKVSARDKKISPGGAAQELHSSKRPTTEYTIRQGSPLRPDVIAIGCSTGGPQALSAVFSALGKVDQPILITQHMPPTFTRILAQHIGKTSPMPCIEVVDTQVLRGGTIYVARGDQHMIVEQRDGKHIIRPDDGPPENYCRPSVDPMLRSLVTIFGRRVLTVILTGMGSDGAKGCKAVVDAGGQVIAQDEATSVVWGMPGAVTKLGICSAVLPVSEIGGMIASYAAVPATARGRA